ncbi:hypothetical protein OU426_05075 [Frigidibacter sp. RF13]|uniref:hypothetical protein n=1 Tax=Frigidibacter sp. RF13 TaxID=2997340 RepID=UPI002271EF2F|nr:hypothetical protein [Frigidibacter sp. RF13]MCY1126220.1 hypothetical protein [Frigidibacter sp. RF13]
MIRPLLALSCLALLAACGPMTIAQAERECFQRARLAAAPRGSVGVGVASNGQAAAKLSLSISSDYIQGRDPAAVYDSCVYQKAGQPPRQPLYARTDWK